MTAKATAWAADHSRKRRSLTLAAIACLLPMPDSWAQNAQAESLAPVVVTASGVPQRVTDLVSDIDARDVRTLRDRGALSINDGLGMMSGISITANGGPAATGSALIRGASAGQTLTLIDGFRVSSVSLGQPTYEGLPISLTDRMEVLRGPGSGVYGADALGGVIQLFSPVAPVGSRNLGELAFGSQSSRRLLAEVASGSARFGGSLRISRETSDGFNATRPAFFAFNADEDGYQRDGIAASLRAQLAAQTNARLVYLRNELDTDFDDGAFAGARVIAQTELTGLTVSHKARDQSDVELKIGRTKDRSESRSSFPGVFETTQDQIGLFARRQITESVQMRIGYERLEQDVDTSAYAPNVAQTRTTNAYLMSFVGRDGPHILQLSLRRDNNNQYDSQTNGTLTYGYTLQSGLRLGFSYATGFRAPGFNDLYFPGFGRTSIRPERSRNLELGAYWGAANADDGASVGSGWQGKFVVYQNKVRDLIVYAPTCPDPDPQFAFGCADNVNRAKLSGISMALGRNFGGLSVSASADFLRARDETLDRFLPRRPRRQLKLLLGYELGDWRLTSDIRAESSRFDDVNNTTRLGGFATINAGVLWQFAPAWQAFLNVVNLTDKDYETAAGFVPQPRLWMLGVRYQQ